MALCAAIFPVDESSARSLHQTESKRLRAEWLHVHRELFVPAPELRFFQLQVLLVSTTNRVSWLLTLQAQGLSQFFGRLSMTIPTLPVHLEPEQNTATQKFQIGVAGIHRRRKTLHGLQRLFLAESWNLKTIA